MIQKERVNELLSKPVAMMTGEELSSLIELKVEALMPQIPMRANKDWRYGIDGIAKLFGCSTAKANRIKASGDIDEAIYQYDRQIIVDGSLALELADKADKRRREQERLNNSVQTETEGSESV